MRDPVEHPGERREVTRDVRLRLAQHGPPRERADGDFARLTLPAGDADVLRDVLIEHETRSVIEIGLAYGSSALAIAEALAEHTETDATHIIIDPHQDQFDHVGWDRLDSEGLTGMCSLMEERSQLALPRLIADGVIADAAFVDGSHVFHNVFVDLSFLRELVRPGGLIVLDDCEWPSVATAVQYFVVNASWEPVALSRPTRLRAFRLPDPPAHPRFDDFQPFGLRTETSSGGR